MPAGIPKSAYDKASAGDIYGPDHPTNFGTTIGSLVDDGIQARTTDVTQGGGKSLGSVRDTLDNGYKGTGGGGGGSGDPGDSQVIGPNGEQMSVNDAQAMTEQIKQREVEAQERKRQEAEARKAAAAEAARAKQGQSASAPKTATVQDIAAASGENLPLEDVSPRLKRLIEKRMETEEKIKIDALEREQTRGNRSEFNEYRDFIEDRTRAIMVQTGNQLGRTPGERRKNARIAAQRAWLQTHPDKGIPSARSTPAIHPSSRESMTARMERSKAFQMEYDDARNAARFGVEDSTYNALRRDSGLRGDTQHENMLTQNRLASNIGVSKMIQKRRAGVQ